MAGRHQIATVMADPPLGWQMQFAYLGGPTVRKVTCLVCGTQGYAGVWRPHAWQARCLLGHPESCPSCGARFTKGALSKHRRCRSGHPACPDHTDTQHRRLQRMTA